MNLDKAREDFWNRNYPDAQEAEVWARCYYTGLEIYRGDECILLANGQYLIDDPEVMLAYINGRRIVAGHDDC